MRRTAFVLAALLAATPALAQDGAHANDRVYRHDGGSGLLESANGKAWWLLLSECAGFYGAIANAREDAGDAEGFARYRDHGVAAYRAAVARLTADRGLDREGAAALIRPRVDGARAVAEAHVARNPELRGTTPINVLRSTCLDLEEAYAREGA